MAAELAQPQRLRVLDEQPQNPPTVWQVADSGPRRLVEPDVNEVPQRPVGADDAQCSVLRINEVASQLDDPPQHRRQAQVTADRHDRIKQTLHPVVHLQDFFGATDQLPEQLIELQVRQHRHDRGSKPWGAIPESGASRTSSAGR